MNLHAICAEPLVLAFLRMRFPLFDFEPQGNQILYKRKNAAAFKPMTDYNIRVYEIDANRWETRGRPREPIGT